MQQFTDDYIPYIRNLLTLQNESKGITLANYLLALYFNV